MQEENKKEITFDSGTYEIIRNRLRKLSAELSNRVSQLNQARKEVFGNVETKLVSNNRINTENKCIASDIVTLGNQCIFGYNVHFGLKEAIQLSDVFSIYTFANNDFKSQDLKLIEDSRFITDFSNLYKYYKNTVFARFMEVDNCLHMVFQLSSNPKDVKTFKWAIKDNALVYIDNRSEHEYRFPTQHEFKWKSVDRDMQRTGIHPHISILDKVFVEAINGTLTIKVEDNTNDGQGIYSEDVDYKDQTLDDGTYRFADLGNLIALEITPFQEEPRYFAYNHKVKEVKKIESMGNACVLLPDSQGIIYSNGYYLQSGEFKLFDHGIKQAKFEKRISSPNGEDFCYVFYEQNTGTYILLPYNVIEQEVKIPIICNGFTIFDRGELCYFKVDEEQTKHHVIQIWQTPFTTGELLASEHSDSLLFKIGNKDIVKAMAECTALNTLLNKEDNYESLYDDLHKAASDILDSYYWINEPETFALSEPIGQIKEAANAGIDEFEKVVQLKKKAHQYIKQTQQTATELFGKAKSSSLKSIDEFVQLISDLRKLRGEVIELKTVRYIDAEILEKIEAEVVDWDGSISERCVQFLLTGKALKPYEDRVSEKEKALKGIKKVIDGKQLEAEVDQISKDLEMLIEIVTNLQIEDTSHATAIVDKISGILAQINKLKAGIKNQLKSLGTQEAKAEFTAQIKLIEQGVINYLDTANTPEKLDDVLNKISIQLEELEGRFADFDEFIEKISEKRTEVYNVFEDRKTSIIEARNKRSITLEEVANRILKGVEKKSQSLPSIPEINGYFASDIMINKLRNIVTQLKEIEAVGKAENIATALQVAKEDAIRKFKDKEDLFEGDESIIKFGNFRFGVNKQALNASIVFKDQSLVYHLTGTNFYQKVKEPELINQTAYWEQNLVSENKEVYRASYLAYKVFKAFENADKQPTEKKVKERITQEIENSYDEGYVKGVHDADALAIYKTLAAKHQELGLLRFDPLTRAFAQYYWFSLKKEERDHWNYILKSAGDVLSEFPDSLEFYTIIGKLENQILKCQTFKTLYTSLISNPHQGIGFLAKSISTYLFYELKGDNDFTISQDAAQILEAFNSYINKNKGHSKFKNTLEQAIKTSFENTQAKLAEISLVLQWVASFVKQQHPSKHNYMQEVVCALLFHSPLKTNVIHANPNKAIGSLLGDHPSLVNGTLEFNYHPFVAKLAQFANAEVPAYRAFRKAKNQSIERFKENLRLNEFEPKVLSSFVRNKLINQVYLPLFGANLSKQLGNIGDVAQTDRMGMLLLVSPPGYGKTTLMEYVANRLGLTFMKINGPSLGYEITSVDPMTAKNAAAKKELEKLNLAFEMGNNVMLYVDDIQHCNPEFLQKFISLADGTRKIEGVYNGVPKTYNLRNNKFCVIMAGNPYTESGDKFQIPDMLANRADIYNLGDIIGNTEDLFNLSLIENSLTSNPLLKQVSNRHFDDIYTLIEMVEFPAKEGLELKGNYTKQEVEDFKAVISKVLSIRNVLLKVNATYVKSAAMEDMYRTEPPFRLQGSYRDMNKLVSKVVPIMNEEELDTLLLSHYQNEAQTLTSSAEENLLKYKELVGKLSAEEEKRWELIKQAYTKKMKIQGLGTNSSMSQIIEQMGDFGGHLKGIEEVLKLGLANKKK